MWYVVQVTVGKEAWVCELITSCVKADEHLRQSGRTASVLSECFVPTYQAERKLAGKFTMFDKKLFPGYVVAISNDVIELNRILRSVSAFTKILGSGNAFTPLDQAEKDFIDSFTEENNRIIPTSRAIVEGNRVIVTEGPLVGHETWIRKVNRRKGTVEIEFEAFGRALSIEVGMITVSKRFDASARESKQFFNK